MSRKNKTPLLRPLNKKGATLYLFPSATEDIGLNINSRTTGVALSHYALLNLNKNNFKFENSTDLVKSLQNYLMNFEVLLTNQDEYNYQDYATVTEHAFWKWIMSEASPEGEGGVSNPFILDSVSADDVNIYEQVYNDMEHTRDNDIENPNRLVQCFGLIDAGNSLSTDFGMFNETYVTIPTSYGNGPVFFRRVKNSTNFRENNTYTAENDDYLEGRITHTCYEEIPAKPQFDPDDNNNYTYKTKYAYEIVKDMPTIQQGLRKSLNKDFITVTSFDDVNIDSDGQISYDSDGTKASPYDLLSREIQFKFNAILLYYSVYDKDNETIGTLATNLFGIIFLEGYNDEPIGDYYIEPTVKKKSFRDTDSEGSYFGNSFSYRVNIKTLSVYDNSDSYIQDNTTSTALYTTDFNKVLELLKTIVNTQTYSLNYTSELKKKYINVKEDLYSIQNIIDGLEENIQAKINRKFNSITSLSLKDLYISNENREDLAHLFIDFAEDNEFKINVSTNFNVDAQKTIELRSYYNYDDATKQETRLVLESGDVNTKPSMHIYTDDIWLHSSDLNVNTTLHQYIVDVFEEWFDPQKNDIWEEYNDGSNESELQEINEAQNEGTEEGAEDENEEPVLGAAQPKSALTMFAALNKATFECKGIYTIKGTKPTEEGYYLRKDKDTNLITTYVYFNGEKFDTPKKCKSGKLYLVNDTIYIFNGVSCVLLGEN